MMHIYENGGWARMRAKGWFADKNVICDLDGPLIDSFDALRISYTLAGWRDPIPFGQSWHEWCPKNVHEVKRRIYQGLYVDYVKRGPAGFLGDMGCHVLTAAGTEAYVLARQHFYPKLRLLGCEKSTKQKLEILMSVPHDVYVDDDKSFIILLGKKGVKSCLIWCSSSLHAATENEPLLEATSLSSNLSMEPPSSSG